MSKVAVTVVMVPRERYGGITSAIESLYAHTTDVPFKLVVIDGALPARVRDTVARAARLRDFGFVHHEYPLAPNEARNLGLRHVDTPWVVFADNDVTFTPGWLPPLLSAAEEFGAWLAGPTVLDGDIARGRIHAAGGRAWFDVVDAKRRYHFKPGFSQQDIATVRPQLQRGPTSMLEFHVLLARADVFQRIGPLDEGFVSLADHDDLVLSVLEAGGTAVYEPRSQISYHDPGSSIAVIQPSDLPMYLLRWSEAWNGASLRHAVRKWRLDSIDPWIQHADQWLRHRRRRAYRVAGPIGRAVSIAVHRLPRRVGGPVERWFCAYQTRRLNRLRRLHGRTA